MKKIILILSAFLLMTQAAFSQNATLRGQVVDEETKEPIIGAAVRAGSTGNVTDFDGNFTLSVKAGNYRVIVSMVGYESFETDVDVKTESNINVSLKSSTMMTAVEIVADIATDRKTPVAFSNISTLKLKEELAGQDLPMVLNSTPGAYATQRGGGDGDARVTLRGFSQRNIAVMMDGIPVNDMENGEVYWSNWFGLNLVTRTMQVQRGLGASKLSLPSVGGTVNIITKGIESQRDISFKQEFGNNNMFQSTIGYNSGRLKGNWGVSVAASYRTNDGWVDGNYSKMYFWYAKLEKQLGKHMFTLAGFGGPQQHGQRSNAGSIQSFDVDYALKLGVPETMARQGQNRGLRYNPSWGYTDSNRTNVVNTRLNYYHKPQISLRHSWEGSKEFFLSTTAYVSIGNGGGTNTQKSIPIDNVSNQLAIFQTIEQNKAFGISSNIINASINNHFWYGALSTARYEFNKNLNASFGVDLRSYTGEHYRKVYDLLGGQYLFAKSISKSDYRSARVSQTRQNLYQDDIYNRNYVGYVNWGGTFSSIEYKNDKISGFVNLSFAQVKQKYEDKILAKTIDLGGQRYYVSYYDSVNNASQNTITSRTPIVGGVMYTVDNPGPFSIRYAEKNGLRIDSTSASNQVVGWVKIPSFNFKMGGAYNLDKNSSVFFNLGKLSRPTRFTNLFYSGYDATKDLGKVTAALNFLNEQITAFEGGYSFKSPTFTVNVNAYYTTWKNKPVDFLPTEALDPADPNSERIALNVTGLGAKHMGIELDLAYRLGDKFKVEGIASVGDWIWNSIGTLTRPDGVQKTFDPTGVHVGDAAQQQFSMMFRYEPIKRAYVSVRGTYFAKNFSDFQPETLTGAFARRESWKLPNYGLMDLNGGYSFKIQKTKLDWRFSVLNVLNTRYITDARNNDTGIGLGTDFDAKSAAVFMGQGIRWNTSLEFSF